MGIPHPRSSEAESAGHWHCFNYSAIPSLSLFVASERASIVRFEPRFRPAVGGGSRIQGVYLFFRSALSSCRQPFVRCLFCQLSSPYCLPGPGHKATGAPSGGMFSCRPHKLIPHHQNKKFFVFNSSNPQPPEHRLYILDPSINSSTTVIPRFPLSVSKTPHRSYLYPFTT